MPRVLITGVSSQGDSHYLLPPLERDSPVFMHSCLDVFDGRVAARHPGYLIQVVHDALANVQVVRVTGSLNKLYAYNTIMTPSRMYKLSKLLAVARLNYATLFICMHKESAQKGSKLNFKLRLCTI